MTDNMTRELPILTRLGESAYRPQVVTILRTVNAEMAVADGPAAGSATLRVTPDGDQPSVNLLLPFGVVERLITAFQSAQGVER